MTGRLRQVLSRFFRPQDGLDGKTWAESDPYCYFDAKEA
jgi:hypothetical protein